MVFMDTVSRKDRFFKGQQLNEEFICFFRHHWIDLLKDILIFIIFVTIVVTTIIHIKNIQDILRGNRELKLFFFTGYLLGTVYMHHFFIQMLNYFVNVGIITSLRIIDHKKSIYFIDNADSIDMSQIQNIERIEQGVLPSILNYGDIKVFLNASNAVVTFRRVPNVQFHYRCIARAKEEITAGRYNSNQKTNNSICGCENPIPIPTEKPQIIRTTSDIYK